MNFPCPCCGYKTFSAQADNSFQLCPVCFWEDDGIQLSYTDYNGGANKVSLYEAQKNYRLFGACEKEMIQYVRPPQENEEREPDWKFLDE